MFERLTQDIIDCLATALGGQREQLQRLLGPPTKTGMDADLALPCFAFAKAAGLAPPQLAQELAAAVSQLSGVQASAAGPFLNIVLDPARVAAALLPALAGDPRQALRSANGYGQTVCVDFSSPNIAKHLAFHHIRSTGIGNALSRMYEAAGWRVVRINFLGDWGTAFGRLIAGWKREDLRLEDVHQSEDPVAFFNQLYVRISQAGADDDSVADEAREWSRRCEQDDPEALELWQVIRDASLGAAKEVYRLLEVEFDDWNGEAHYRHAGGEIVEELSDKGLLSEDQGAQVVHLADQGLKKPCLILRSDGGSLYATRDLAACEDRAKRYGFDRSLYVVDLGQGLHFREWFAVARKLGRSYADGLRHIGFGVVQMWNEEAGRWAKTATRKGVPMMLMDVLQEAIDRARAIVEDKNPDLDEIEKQAVATAVGCGAVLFNDLKNGRKNDIKFKFDDALNMQGETGPYLQFAHARLCSIERKVAERFGAELPADPALLTRSDEKAVLVQISRMQAVLERAVSEDEPSILATGLLQLASQVSAWLTAGNADSSARVLGEDRDVSAARVQLVRCARVCLAEGLRLLGLQAPQRM